MAVEYAFRAAVRLAAWLRRCDPHWAHRPDQAAIRPADRRRMVQHIGIRPRVKSPAAVRDSHIPEGLLRHTRAESIAMESVGDKVVPNYGAYAIPIPGGMLRRHQPGQLQRSEHHSDQLQFRSHLTAGF